MIDINYYRKIQNAYTTTDIRDSQRYTIKNELNRDFNKSLDAYSVLVNGCIKDLNIIKTQNLDEKKIKSRPDEKLYIGDSIKWQNTNWLVTDIDANIDIVSTGLMKQCNYLLKWQNENGDIIERWAVVKKLSGDVVSNQALSLAEGKLSVNVPIDSETIKLKESMSKKFFIDNNTTTPTAYELIDAGNVSSCYNGHGVTDWIVKKVNYSPTPDDLLHWVCEYKPVTNDNETVDSWYMEISCPIKTIKPNNVVKTMTAKLCDENGVEITNDITYEWTVTTTIDPKYITYSSNLKTFSISLSNDCEDVGEIISVKCASKYTGQVDVVDLEIREVY